MARQKLNPMEEMQKAQAAAHAFVVNYLKTVTIGVPATLPDEEYKRVMDGITTAMSKSWADGYLTAKTLLNK